MKKILDACCGSRMFWFDKQNTDSVYMDNRMFETTLCDGRKLSIRPDVVGDFRNIPFPDGTFQMVVFDPPHLVSAGEKSWLAQKYGRLNRGTWKEDIAKGFSECLRVLKPDGVLIFKWNEEQIPVSEVKRLAPINPLFGQKGRKTHWMVFMKQGE